jgi:hypothetical protein
MKKQPKKKTPKQMPSHVGLINKLRKRNEAIDKMRRKK